MSLWNLLQSLQAAPPARERAGRQRRRLLLEGLEDRRLLSAVQMTDQEQLLLELVNRTRQDPAAEATRYNIDLNQDLSPNTISTDAKQPLAPHQFLVDAAGLHSQDMLNNNFFSHTNQQGLSPTNRTTAAGYIGGTGENIAWAGSTGSIDQVQKVYQLHENLFRSSGHRENMLYPAYSEIGTGVRYDVYTTGGRNYNAGMVTESFGLSSNLSFITGVAFTDSVDNNGFYEVGESAAGLTVVASTALGSSYQTTTGNSGGYSLAVPNGDYTVTFSGGSYSGEVSFLNVSINGQSAKVDLDTQDASWVVPQTLPIVSTSTTTASVSEDGGQSLAVTFERTGSLESGLTVSFGVSGTAEFGADYSQSGATTFSGAAGTIQFLPGAATALLTLTPINEYKIEASETIGITSVETSEYSLGETSQAALTITDTDTDTIHIYATSGDDVVQLNVQADYILTVNGQDTTIDRASVRNIYLHGEGGNDTLTVLADSGLSAAVLRVGETDVTGADYNFYSDSWETINVTAAAAATATATLFDAANDDSLFAYPGYTTISDGTYQNRVDGFDFVNAIATAGGSNDQAYFYDSAGDDSWFAYPTSARMEGSGFRNYAEGFDRMVSIATAGGSNDQAYLYDSAGDDTLNALPNYATLTGTGYFSYAEGYDRVLAFANSGGSNDRAFLYDSSGSDVLNALPAYAYLTGTGYYSYADGFDQVLAYSSAGGADRAYLYDSSGNDSFFGDDSYAVLSGGGYLSYTNGFAEVLAYSSNGGVDTARLDDSAGNDVFSADPQAASMVGTGYLNFASGFDQVMGYANAGNAGGVGDRAYLYDSVGDDSFNVLPTYGYMSGSGFYNYSQGFDKVHGFANSGGFDKAYMYDSNGDDTLTTHPTHSYLSGASTTGDAFYSYVESFDQVLSYAVFGTTPGGTDQALYYDSAGNDTFIATPEVAYMSGTDFFNYGNGFDRNIAIAHAGNAGGTGDVAHLYDSAGDDTLNALPEYVSLVGAGFQSYAEGFDRVNSQSSGGNDTAYLYGSAGNDSYFQQDTLRRLSGTNFYLSADSYRNVLVDLRGGTDSAQLYDTAADEVFAGSNAQAELYSAAYYTRVNDVENVALYGNNGGTNQLSVNQTSSDPDQIDYVLTTAGSWI